MYAAVSRSETMARGCAESTAPVHGIARIRFARRAGATRLAGLEQKNPLRVLFPVSPVGEPPLAALATISGGLVGGDRLGIEVAADPGTEVLVTAQAAEKVYRSAGPECRVEIDLSVGDGAWLEWLPQETILFDGARLSRRTVVAATSEARILAGEILVFGRIARGERLGRGLVRDVWEVRRDGRLVWADAFHMEGDLTRPLAASAGLGGACAYATAIYAAGDAETHLDAARRLLAAPGVRAGATLVEGILILRWIGADSFRLRIAFGRFWAGFRRLAGGYSACLPRLWHV